MIERIEVQILVLLLIASGIGMLARKLRLPYTLALTAAGLVLGFAQIDVLTGVNLSGDLLLLLFLPALLFEAAFHIDPAELRRQIVPVLTLAVVGVGIAVSATAGMAYAGLHLTGLVSEFGVPHALLFAAVLSATDPISVLALFKELGVPRRLYLLVEGESLLNDGVAVVVFVVVSAALGLPGLHGAAHPPTDDLALLGFGLRTFAWMVIGGVATGVAVGGAGAFVTRFTDDHLIETMLTTIVAYGAFLLAEEIHASGVLSTVCAGIVTGSAGRAWGMSVSTRVAVQDFWEYVAFLVNSFIFLLVGLELVPSELLRHGPAILVGFLAVTGSRALVVYTLVPLTNRFSTPIPLAWRHIMVWGGLRGSLSMVLILTVPADFPGRDVLVALVFGAVGISLFAQGLTMGALLERLGLRSGGPSRTPYELARGRALAARHAAEEADHLAHRGTLEPLVHSRLAAWYRARMDVFEAEAHAIGGEGRLHEQLATALHRLADAEHDAIAEALRGGTIETHVARQLAAEVDERVGHLSAAAHGDATDLGSKLDEILAAPNHAPDSPERK